MAEAEVVIKGGLVVDGTGAPGFEADVAIAGGLLFLVGMGPGPFALDNRSSGGGKGARRR